MHPFSFIGRNKLSLYRILVVASIALTLAPSARALEGEYNSIDDFMSGIPNMTVVNEQVVEGDLNQDTGSDKVVLVNSESDGITYDQIFVLLQTPNGGLRIAGKSMKVRGMC